MQSAISIVMPIYNEIELLPELFARMHRVMSEISRSYGLSTEWILVNDGSSDNSMEYMRAQALSDENVVVIDLSRNFGHQPAIQAGLEYAHGDAVVVMDGDLQDPPEVILDMLKAWRAGSRVVIAKRRSRSEGGIKGLFFRGFHNLLSRISDTPIESNTGVFGLLDRRAVNELLRLKERNRFLPGLRSWIGYEQATVLYDREQRAAGAPKQTLGRLFRYAFDAIFSFSHKPLRAIWTMGFIVSLVCIGYALFLIALRIFNVNVVPGFTTPTVAILFLGGIQLISIGILGEYLGRIYDEVKQRPQYVIHEIVNRHTANADQSTEYTAEYERPYRHE
jgi:glycosyltransferase involved in cell wall biosynthesis